MIDCCARCGDVGEAERVVNGMIGGSGQSEKPNNQSQYFWEEQKYISHKKVPIQAWTALLKGYVHSGAMDKADSLFCYLCKDLNNTSTDDAKKRKFSGGKGANGPNVRTLNTLLRGCLWTATTSVGTVANATASNQAKKKKKHDNDREAASRNELVGGISTAKRAWELCNNGGVVFDSSSYEYFITMLCQSLQCEAATECLGQMKRQFNLHDEDGRANDDPTLLESLAVCLVCISRAHALLGEVDNARRCALEALGVIEQFNSASSVDINANNASTTRKTTGGKQAWKSYKGKGNVESIADNNFKGRREESNKLFRSHRISELKTEATSLQELCSGSFDVITQDRKYVARCMMTRLLYFSGGGTTGLDDILEANKKDDDAKDTQQSYVQWIHSLWHSFGLKEVVRLAINEDDKTNDIGSLIQKENDHTLTLENCNRLRTYLLGKDYNVISDNGRINFKRVFSRLSGNSSSLLGKSDINSNDVPLHIELGAGSGDWAALQAQLNPSENYVTVELRADRVAQTFAKGVLHKGNDEPNTKITFGKGGNQGNDTSSLGNLCCVGSECGSFLRDRITPATARTIFVNHPEPPTQTSTNDDEQAHMLNAQTILASARCLAKSGRLIIVTDNLIYARLICRTLANTLDKGKLVSVSPKEVNDLVRVESFNNGKGKSVHLYEGKPSLSIGHYIPIGNTGGNSYFDRLWKRGAGKHAEMRKRYIIAVRTNDGRSDNSGDSSYTPKPKYVATAGKSNGAVDNGKGSNETKGNKKRSAEKQKQRNERRLLKKQQQIQQQQK